MAKNFKEEFEFLAIQNPICGISPNTMMLLDIAYPEIIIFYTTNRLSSSLIFSVIPLVYPMV